LPEDSKIVFVLGAPGAGKGTHCARVKKEYGYTHLSTGDLLRAEVAAGSELGLQAAEIMQAGGFVPTSLICDLLVDAMIKSGEKNFLVDGFPRKLDQLQEFEAKVRRSRQGLGRIPCPCMQCPMHAWMPAWNPVSSHCTDCMRRSVLQILCSPSPCQRRRQCSGW
jgi:adenylate kinase family enzyme